MTRAPSAASERAISCPIPPEAAVTRAVLFLSPRFMMVLGAEFQADTAPRNEEKSDIPLNLPKDKFQAMKPVIRRLNPGEADLYRTVRLESLKESPEAFASTHQLALERSEESWRQQADASAAGTDRATFLVLTDKPVGIAALYRNPEKSEEGEMIQVWVAPEYRGGDVAGRLMDTLFRWAAGNRFQTILAEVTPDNSRALRFYEKQGFVRIGREAGQDETNRLLMRRVEPLG
ncbi:MAG: GNAT family N-acetyltransferase [Verrucomicrobiaceae bacterium]|nr:MAG: GNAT family N-acetyltransferase [Verrucomicrobiaceae bacterium]